MGTQRRGRKRTEKAAPSLTLAGHVWKPQSGPRVTLMAMGQVGLDSQIAAMGNFSESP